MCITLSNNGRGRKHDANESSIRMRLMEIKRVSERVNILGEMSCGDFPECHKTQLVAQKSVSQLIVYFPVGKKCIFLLHGTVTLRTTVNKKWVLRQENTGPPFRQPEA